MVYFQFIYLYQLHVIYHELLNFEDEILLKEGRNVTPGFLNSEPRTQDDNIMKILGLLY